MASHASGKLCSRLLPLVLLAACGENRHQVQQTVVAGSDALTGLECTYSQGFWKNHAEAWPPVSAIRMGQVAYGTAEVLTLFTTPPKGDDSLVLAHQLAAARLNEAALAGGRSLPVAVQKSLADADALLAAFGSKRLPYAIKSIQATDLATQLTSFNEGASGISHCTELITDGGGAHSDAGGIQDAGIQDAGIQDAGIQDAGIQDAGIQDAGIQDAGIQDAGIQDAGIQDAGGSACANFGAAAGFSVYTSGSFTGLQADVEGAIAVGGTLRAESYSIGDKLLTNWSQDLVVAAAVVGGDLELTNSQLNGDAWVGGAIRLSGATITGQQAKLDPHAVHYFPFEATSASLARLATRLGMAAATGKAEVSGGGAVVLTSTSAQAVFDVAAEVLAKASGLQLRARPDAAVLVRVTGTPARLGNLGFDIGGVPSSRILYFFPDALTLTLEGVGVQGTVFAPRAAVQTSNSQVVGSVIAASYAGSGETHLSPLRACLSLPPLSSP